MTWNVGYEEHWASKRAPAILDVLANDTANSTMSTIDVVCLTEVWTGPITIKNYILGLQHVYPYSLSLLNNSFINSPASSRTRYQPPCLDYYSLEVAAEKAIDFADCFLSCLEERANNNVDVGVNNLENISSIVYACGVQCLLSTYADVFQDKNTDPCWACLIETLYSIYKIHTSPKGSVSFADSASELSMCYTDTSQPWSQTLGLLVLSKVPIELVEINYYKTFVVPRGYIAFNVPSWSNTLVVCTHITPINGDLRYVFNYSTQYHSWMEENIGSTKQIVSKMSQPPFNDYDNQIITGDLNHSPALLFNNREVVGALAKEAYQVLKNWSLGTLENLYVATNLELNLVDENGNSTLCTACEDNSVCPVHQGKLYDWIWSKGPYWTSTITGPKYSYRLYDETVELMVNGVCRQSKLSDHYPVLVTSRSPLLEHQLAKLSWCTFSSNSAFSTRADVMTMTATTMLLVCFMSHLREFIH